MKSLKEMYSGLHPHRRAGGLFDLRPGRRPARVCRAGHLPQRVVGQSTAKTSPRMLSMRLERESGTAVLGQMIMETVIKQAGSARLARPRIAQKFSEFKTKNFPNEAWQNALANTGWRKSSSLRSST